MTAITVNKIIEGLGTGSFEILNAEIDNNYTYESKFGTILGVWISEEETSSSQTPTYTTSGGTITFKVDAAGTYGVLIVGLM